MIHIIELDNDTNLTWKWQGDGSNNVHWCLPDDMGSFELPDTAPEYIEDEILLELLAQGHLDNYVFDEDEEDFEEFYNDPADRPSVSKDGDVPLDFHGDFDSMTEETQDKILNPSHYKIFPAGTYKSGIEYTDLCKKLFENNGLDSYTNHLLGQCLKYMTRVGQKDAASQDIGKASWYLIEAQANLNKTGKYSDDDFIPIDPQDEGGR